MTFKEFENARLELGEEEFYRRLRTVFGVQCLDFVNTIVINLPGSCYANCAYCIDKKLRESKPNIDGFLDVCKAVFSEFPNIKHISITGGSIAPEKFNELVRMICEKYTGCSITWNTNGIGIDERYLDGIREINHINLHRNAVTELENAIVFRASKPIMTIEEAKSLFGKSLTLRVTVDENFDLDEYAKFGIPLYLNRMLPGNPQTDNAFSSLHKKLKLKSEIDRRRRNVYLNAEYKGVPVRVCLGDKIANHVPGRQPTYLNVVIIHRSGTVCGSWYEDDKVLLNGEKGRED